MLLELICSVAFTIEVIFRLAVVDGLWPLITDVCLYIDVIAILPFIFDLVCVATGDFGPLPEFEGEPEPEVVPDNGLAVHTNPFDWLRVARLLRLFKLARHFEGSRVIVDTLKRSFYALLVPLLFLLTGVIIFAGLLTYVEQDGEARDDFGNILKSSWFVLVTFSTVGYGDVTPRTAWGQLVTSVAILCGVLFMAMPITIVGNNFATVWEEKEAVAVVLKMQVSNGPPLLPPQLHRHHNSTAASTATSLSIAGAVALAPAWRARRHSRLLRVRREWGRRPGPRGIQGGARRDGHPHAVEEGAEALQALRPGRQQFGRLHGGTMGPVPDECTARAFITPLFPSLQFCNIVFPSLSEEEVHQLATAAFGSADAATEPRIDEEGSRRDVRRRRERQEAAGVRPRLAAPHQHAEPAEAHAEAPAVRRDDGEEVRLEAVRDAEGPA